MMTDSRIHLDLTLRGPAVRDGEVALGDLARIAGETQQLVRRLGRSIAGQSGPGRTSSAVEAGTDLVLVGIRSGSTVLEIAGPEVHPELFSDTEVPPSVGVQAIELVVDGIEALHSHGALPGAFDSPSTDALASWLAALDAVAEEVVVGAGAPGRATRQQSMHPGALRSALPTSPAAPSDAVESITVEGVLYKLNLRTHRYGIEDDLGNSIEIVTSDEDDAAVGALVNHRAQARGTPRRDAAGRLESVIDASLTPAPNGGIDRAEFWRPHELDGLLEGKRPIVSIDELAIEGLDDAEIDAFLAAIDE
jgi:hypothetical protein